MDTASIVTKTLFLSHKLSSLSTPLSIAHPLSTPLSPLFILFLSCYARWLYSPKVRSLYFGSRIVTLFSLRLFDCSYIQCCRGGKHDNNPEATLSISGFPAVFNPLFWSTLLLFFYVSLLIIFYVLCSWWREKKKYINKNRMIEKLKNEEWEGCGPPVKTLVRRTACEEPAACQFKSNGCWCLMTVIVFQSI